MDRPAWGTGGTGRLVVLSLVSALAMVACGGGDGSNATPGGPTRTYLSAAATDPDGDTLHYQWRVTAGTLQNADAPQAIWTMPDGPGVHFAYLTVTDDRGGHTVQQYAVATDALQIPAPTPAARQFTAPSVPDTAGATARVTVEAGSPYFQPPAGSAAPAAARTVYRPDVLVDAVQQADPTVRASATTDWRGQAALPMLPAGTYDLRCTAPHDLVTRPCGTLSVAGESPMDTARASDLTAAQNLRLHGHVALADGRVCGWRDGFVGIEDAATVQLLRADGSAVTRPMRVNAYGDYALDAPVGVREALTLKVRCGRDEALLPVPADAAGYAADRPIERSHTLANRAPAITRVIATGPDGNVRGQMIVPETDAASNALPGPDRFLTYKGLDTRQSACRYYRAIGAVADCDAQGQPTDAISFEDWKRARRLAPYTAGNTEVRATYINRIDLNLVRRMVATQSAANDVAFYVCNHPGPSAAAPTATEVDEVITTALADERQIACVAMDWSVTPGTNGERPFTKFLTFGPDGRLLLSVNLDGRGEKFMPGACVACHGGAQYAGRFPERGNPSPNLGSNFLPFDTGNYLFSTALDLTEPAQGAALKRLNELVVATQPTKATTALVKGWYAAGGTQLDKAYVPPAWTASGQPPEAADFYRRVIGTSCRTCHTAMRDGFDWDSQPAALFGRSHVCGGGANLERSGSMANALITHDNLMRRAQADPTLAALMQRFLGCVGPADDPMYPRR